MGLAVGHSKSATWLLLVTRLLITKNDALQRAVPCVRASNEGRQVHRPISRRYALGALGLVAARQVVLHAALRRGAETWGPRWLAIGLGHLLGQVAHLMGVQFESDTVEKWQKDPEKRRWAAREGLYMVQHMLKDASEYE